MKNTVLFLSLLSFAQLSFAKCEYAADGSAWRKITKGVLKSLKEKGYEPATTYSPSTLQVRFHAGFFCYGQSPTGEEIQGWGNSVTASFPDGTIAHSKKHCELPGEQNPSVEEVVNSLMVQIPDCKE